VEIPIGSRKRGLISSNGTPTEEDGSNDMQKKIQKVSKWYPLSGKGSRSNGGVYIRRL
jgi:hypothetical protein